MRHSKGFSLIETLVAVALASIATLSLLGVTSNASRISENIISRFDESMSMGIIAGVVDEGSGQTLRMRDVLQKRYSIDNTEILDSVDAYSCQVRLMPKESINSSLVINNVNTVVAPTLSVQKIVLQSEKSKKVLYGISSGTY